MRLLNRMLVYTQKLFLFEDLKKDLSDRYGIDMSNDQQDNVINVMTNEFPAGTGKSTYTECVFIEKDEANESDYRISKSFEISSDFS